MSAVMALGAAHGSHQDIRLPGNGGQVFGAGMAHGDRGVAASLPLHQEYGEGLAHDVAAAADDYIALPAGSWPLRRSNSRIPAGVHEVNVACPWASLPRLKGWMPSTSLAG